MESTTNRTGNQTKKKPDTNWIRRTFGGEFLLSKQMLPWYPYLLFVLILTCTLIVSEQLIVDKKERITTLENQYKAELSKLKANNQFIPYEENQLLIQKMEERGYQLNEEHTFTIFIKKPAAPKKGFFSFLKNSKSEDAVADKALENNEEDEEQQTEH